MAWDLQPFCQIWTEIRFEAKKDGGSNQFEDECADKNVAAEIWEETKLSQLKQFTYNELKYVHVLARERLAPISTVKQNHTN